MRALACMLFGLLKFNPYTSLFYTLKNCIGLHKGRETGRRDQQQQGVLDFIFANTRSPCFLKMGLKGALMVAGR